LVIANYRGVSASSCWVTIIIGTCVVVIAINWNVADNSSDNRALFSCAFVEVAKLFWGEDASFGFVASVISARVVVVTSDSCILASFYGIASIGGANVVVVTVEDRVLTSKSWAASINGTCISVTAALLFRVIANSVTAFVDSAEIVISAFWSSADTLVGLCIASINSARVTIITSIETRIHVHNLSCCRIALVVERGFASSSWDLETSDSQIFQAESITSASCGFTCAINRDEFSNVLASFGGIAIVDSAFVSILTVDWSINDSFNCIAGSDGASVWSCDCHRRVEAVSGGCIASLSGASVFVVASFLGVNAVSIYTSINSA
jgi:hypothetical protein